MDKCIDDLNKLPLLIKIVIYEHGLFKQRTKWHIEDVPEFLI